MEEIRRRLDLTPCNGCTDDELTKNSLSLCPHCRFNPNDFVGADTAIDSLNQAEQEVDQLHSAWTNQLIGELQDPSVLASLNALKPEERKLVDDFVAAKSLPVDISDAFINAINTVLSGLKRKVVKASDLAISILGDGTPIKVDEVRDRFEKWIDKQIGTDEKAVVRFALEK